MMNELKYCKQMLFKYVRDLDFQINEIQGKVSLLKKYI